MDEGKWYRVVERMSPLCGCDVAGEIAVDESGNEVGFLMICRLRRVDVFAGDRPFQLVAAEDENLGLLIDYDHLEESPIQDDTVELTTGSPYGRCVEDSELSREDSGLVLRYAHYEWASQISLEIPGTGDANGRTFLGEDHYERVRELIDMFTGGESADDIVAAMGRD